MKREPAEIDVLAGDLDRVHRRVVRRHLHQRLQAAQALEIFVVEALLAGVERRRQALSAACRLGDDLEALRARLGEQQRLPGAFDDRAQPGERDRLVVNLDLAEIDQPLDEAAQPVFFQINLGRSGFGVHRVSLASLFLLSPHAARGGPSIVRAPLTPARSARRPSPLRGEGLSPATRAPT